MLERIFEFTDSQIDKLLTLFDLAITIAAEISYLVIWFLAQHALKLGLVRAATVLGQQYAEHGHDYEKVMAAHAIGCYGMLGTVVVLLAKDLCKLILASYHELHMLYKKSQYKITSEGWKSST